MTAADAEAARELADSAFIVSAEKDGTQHRIEAVVASAAPGKWYERVVIDADENDDDAAITCTCTATPDGSAPQCMHAAAALVAVGPHLPGLIPGRRRTQDGPRIEIGTSESESDWLDLHIRVTVEGEEIDFADLFSALVRGESVYVMPDDRYFSLQSPQLDALRRVIEEAKTLNDRPAEALRLNRRQADLWQELAELELVSAEEHRWWRSIAQLSGEVSALDPPARLHAALRDYQLAGFSWLSFLYEQQLGGVLADDMGLGKTVQTLAMILRARDAEPSGAPFLIVAPTSVVGNWQAEAARFAPDLGVVVISETMQRSGQSLDAQSAGADVVVTSYALFRMEAHLYQGMDWSGLILDEAQMLKNPDSQAHRAARDFTTSFKLAITGTPLENNLLELWALVSLCCPGLLGRREQFAQVYRTPIEKQRDDEALSRLQRRLRPFLLRRTKEKVAQELPPKQEQILSVTLHPQHRAIYDRRLQRERQRVLGLVEDVGSHRFEILAALNHLRQLALDTELTGDGHAPSAKLEALQDMLAEVTSEGHRVLVLSQYTRFLTKARQTAEQMGVACSYLDGSTVRRQDVIDAFRAGETEVFFVSLKAGGFGLNLVEADYVVLLDPWWNPAAEEQAIDRAHRIGQKRTVMVYRMVSAGTIEEKVMALQESKRQLFASVLSGEGTGQAPALSATEIRDLLG